MIGDSGVTTRHEAEHGADGGSPRGPAMAPVRAPSRQAGGREGPWLLVLMALLTLAYLSYLTGAPLFIAIGLIMTAAVLFALHIRSRRDERRAAVSRHADHVPRPAGPRALRTGMTCPCRCSAPRNAPAQG